MTRDALETESDLIVLPMACIPDEGVSESSLLADKSVCTVEAPLSKHFSPWKMSEEQRRELSSEPQKVAEDSSSVAQ